MTSIPIYVGEVHCCPYLPAHQARLGWIGPQIHPTTTVYTRLVEAGFRRSGSSVYRPMCGDCSACVPVRIPVAEFVPNRSQRRVWKNNADLIVWAGAAEFRDEHYQLYRRYQAARHPGGAMASANTGEYFDFLTCPWLETEFTEFRLEGGRLLAVSVADRLLDGLSAVYTFFDPQYPKRSLGSYAILSLVKRAGALGLRWCYLGYWIAGSGKMGYKAAFRPLEARMENRWLRFAKGSPRRETLV